jgi:CDP-paratose 2-epimerase
MRVLITGHRGFIGKKTWKALMESGYDVFGIDDLSRKSSTPLEDPKSVIADVASIRTLTNLDLDFDWVIHLAAQVSVVDGELNPERDFQTNAVGTFEVLQWAKERGASVIYSSSNKVFGELQGRKRPIPDDTPISPSTNYGVSKCVGAQYVADYGKGWVLHQSCIYGEDQIGDINQGWIGWLRQQIMKGEEITCFGTGEQIRDLLHVDDLVSLYIDILEGKIDPGSYVVGGGSKNAFSFREVVELLGGTISHFESWRPRDQEYFVSANSGLGNQGWSPRINFEDKFPSLRFVNLK